MGYSRLVHALAQSGAASATTPSRNTTGANLIVIVTASNDGGGFVTVSDSQSNTWTGLTSYSDPSAPGVRIWYCFSPSTSSTHTFTVSGTSEFPGIAMAAYSGAATSPFDVQNGTNNASGGTTLQPGSVTPSANGELLIVGLASGGDTGDTFSIDSSFTMVESNCTSGGFGVSLADLVQTTATAVNPTVTSTASCRMAVAIATFKAAAGGGGPTFRRGSSTTARAGSRRMFGSYAPEQFEKINGLYQLNTREAA